MREKNILFISMLLILILTGCAKERSASQKAEDDPIKIEELQIELKQYQEAIEGYKLEIKNIEEEKKEYKLFIDKTLASLDENLLLDLAKSEWHYEITIDEMPIPKDGNVKIDKDSFKIIYSQEQSLLSSIEPELSHKGCLSDDFFEHLKIIGREPNNIVRTDGTVSVAFIYEFEKLPQNTNFKLEISNELKERLDLETQTINIQVNY